MSLVQVYLYDKEFWWSIQIL